MTVNKNKYTHMEKGQAADRDCILRHRQHVTLQSKCKSDTCGLFAFACLFDTILIPPLIPFSMKRCMSTSVRSSSSVCVYLRRASQDRPGAL